VTGEWDQHGDLAEAAPHHTDRTSRFVGLCAATLPVMDRITLAASKLGLERKTVRLAPSDPAWASAFDSVRSTLESVLAVVAVAVEHVGSTAVPGLPAKPILDIAVGLRPGIDREAVTKPLETLGFICRGQSEEGEGGLNLMFGWEDRPRHRVVNLHAVTFEGPRWREYVVFRDRLRADPKTRDAYAKVKEDLAQQFPDDRNAYIAGKDEFIARILANEAGPFVVG
jgi:GrpB-like predicted nucleotidyltransferase (UPF0157 family)